MDGFNTISYDLLKIGLLSWATLHMWLHDNDNNNGAFS